MGQFEPLLWERRPRRARRARPYGASTIDPDVEFAGRPVGRLGRRLLCDVELYLAFFALAQQPARCTDRA